MIKEVLIVEGRSDVARIRASHIDADMITTDGFSLRPDTLRQIACAYEKRGIIILTDPDQAGERIRRYLSQRFPKAKHAFIPRKDAIANDDLGVEQASPECAVLGIRYGTAKPFLRRLNHYGVSREEWFDALQQIEEETEHERR